MKAKLQRIICCFLQKICLVNKKSIESDFVKSQQYYSLFCSFSHVSSSYSNKKTISFVIIPSIFTFHFHMCIFAGIKWDYLQLTADFCCKTGGWDLRGKRNFHKNWSKKSCNLQIFLCSLSFHFKIDIIVLDMLFYRLKLI